jgi:hypothetical protein
VIEGFLYQSVYYPTYRRFGGQKVEKKIVIYAAFVKDNFAEEGVRIRPSEHQSFHWEAWHEQKDYRNNTITSAKHLLNQHFAS